MNVLLDIPKPAHRYEVSTSEEVLNLLSADCPVGIGVSGGKDSAACAFATVEYLDSIGHRGPRVLTHSDLGRVEWKDSLPACNRLADALGMELVIVRRKQGDLMDRWLQRWDDNMARYINLEVVKVILPWSTPSMRFCTSELKTTLICRDLAARFPNRGILSVNGIRRQESPDRAKAPISCVQKSLAFKTLATYGFDWHSIIEWTLDEVLSFLSSRGHALHEAYTVFGSSRVSCCFCILGSLADLIASSTCPENHAIYREMVELEIVSGFAFQGARWLGDVAPHLLGRATLDRLAGAKVLAQQRNAIEARIPKHLLYTAGWPTCIPTQEEAVMLAEVRSAIGDLYGVNVLYTTPETVLDRYRYLMDENARKTQQAKGKTPTQFATAPRQMQLTMIGGTA